MKFENYWTEKHGGLFSGKNFRPEVGFLISPFSLTHLSPLHSSAAQGTLVTRARCLRHLVPATPPRAPSFTHPPAASLARASGHSWRCAVGPPDFSQHLVDVQTVNKYADTSLSRAGISDKRPCKWCCLSECQLELERRVRWVGRCTRLSPMRVLAPARGGGCPREGLGTGFLFLEEAEPHPSPFSGRLNITYPMLFKLTNKNSDRVTHCGVLEFVADEGICYLPHWVSSRAAQPCSRAAVTCGRGRGAPGPCLETTAVLLRCRLPGQAWPKCWSRGIFKWSEYRVLDF